MIEQKNQYHKLTILEGLFKVECVITKKNNEKDDILNKMMSHPNKFTSKMSMRYNKLSQDISSLEKKRDLIWRDLKEIYEEIL